MKKLIRHRVIIVIIVISVFILIGCSLFSTTEKLKPISVDRWLNNSSCKAPCWEEITPGITSLYDIDLDKIERINHFIKANPESILAGINATFEGTYRYWWDVMRNGEDQGYINATTNKYIFDKIEFNFGRNATLENVIDHFGEPDTIGIDFVPIEWMQCRVTLFFQEKRVWIIVPGYTIISPYSVNIQPGSSFTAYYVSDSIRDGLENTSQLYYEPRLNYLYNPKEQLISWEGYKQYRCQKGWMK